MKLIDEQYMKTPVYGSRSMRDHLNRQGYPVNRKRVQRLMRLMGLEAIYPKPRTSKPHPGHRIYRQRKGRKGAFWEDRYHATAVQDDCHLI